MSATRKPRSTVPRCGATGCRLPATHRATVPVFGAMTMIVLCCNKHAETADFPPLLALRVERIDGGEVKP